MMSTNRDSLKILINAILQRVKGFRGNWNQNDPSADDYIKNRPFYTSDPVETVSVDNVSVECADLWGEGFGVADEPFAITLVEGETCNVTFNNVEYECVAYFAKGPECPAIGDGTSFGVTGGGNGEPFFIYAMDDGHVGLMTTEIGTHTISITQFNTIIHKIDEKYLPKIETIGWKGTGIDAEIFNNENNEASGSWSHAEGSDTTASGQYSHAEGRGTTASGVYSHAEGYYNTASNRSAHSEGERTTASGVYSHAEGSYTTASGNNSHAEGYNSMAIGDASHAEGSPEASSDKKNVTIKGDANATEYTITSSVNSYYYSVGTAVKYGDKITVITEQDVANKKFSVKETLSTSAINGTAYLLLNTVAIGKASHAEGSCTTAYGKYSHAEGYRSATLGNTSHAEGSSTTASGNSSHAEGSDTTASGVYSHAEGSYTTASGNSSHAEGQFSKAFGDYSHAEGLYTIATSKNQHVQGKYNIEDAVDKYAHIVGNGEVSARSNAYTLDWSGNAWYAGDIRIGGTSYEDANVIATETYVDSAIINNQKTCLSLIDVINGYTYILEMRNGNLVSRCAIAGIQITNLPEKTEYEEGDVFDPTGMIVSAVCQDGSTFEITNYTYSTDGLTANDTQFVISYEESGNVYTTTVNLVVNVFDPDIVLIDFTYTTNDDGTYTITGWKQTLNGEPSTKMIVPNNALIKL